MASAAALALLLSAAWAQDRGDDTPMVPGPQTMPPPHEAPMEWHTFVDTERGFALDVPSTHRVAASGASYYVHTTHLGEPTVPDMSLVFLRDTSVEAQLKEQYGPDADTEQVALGPGTEGVRVTVTYHAGDGTPYRESSYLVPSDDGVVRIMRWESFDWDPFDDVARSFRWWTPVRNRGE
ncbi:MAG: hypothetical protein U5K81_02435 [Trueperaceae bacterium]|nr:hypothetical protein [Trueperaceae bacterium]